MEIESEYGIVTTLYQPQLESFQDNNLEGRQAVTIKRPDEEMIFGAIWFRARMLTDLDSRTVVLEKLEILKTHFPDILDEKKISEFSDLLSAAIESRNLEMDLDRILASLDEVENLKQLSDQINKDPPNIYFRKTPAILLTIDGDPILRKEDDSGLEYVVNTPFLIVRDPKKEDYYIHGGPFWYPSPEILQGWDETNKVPSKINKFAEESREASEQDTLLQSYAEAPELIVVTEPAELILVDGEPQFERIEGTDMSYALNTDKSVLLIDGVYYCIDDAVWFSSDKPSGPGKFVLRGRMKWMNSRPNLRFTM